MLARASFQRYSDRRWSRTVSGSTSSRRIDIDPHGRRSTVTLLESRCDAVTSATSDDVDDDDNDDAGDVNDDDADDVNDDGQSDGECGAWVSSTRVHGFAAVTFFFRPSPESRPRYSGTAIMVVCTGTAESYSARRE